MIATSGFLTALECTKFVFGHWGSLQRSPRTPNWFKGALLLRGGEGKERDRGGEGEDRRREGKG